MIDVCFVGPTPSPPAVKDSHGHPFPELPIDIREWHDTKLALKLNHHSQTLFIRPKRPLLQRRFGSGRASASRQRDKETLNHYADYLTLS